MKKLIQKITNVTPGSFLKNTFMTLTMALAVAIVTCFTLIIF